MAWGIFFTESLAAVFDAVLWSFLVPNFGWVFILSTFGFLAFSLYLAFSRYGKVRLGAQDEQPEFSTVSWIAMMFSAGMGIGLMFFGVAEPLSHMGAPPFGLAEANTKAAAQVAMEYSYFHWAFHPWAIYAIMGLALAYFTFRKGMPNLISTAFYPLLGDRVYGPIGKTIDILAIFATLFGSATSLGLGALQINQGLNAVFGIGGREAVGLAIVVIAVLTLAFILSAISGVHRGHPVDRQHQHGPGRVPARLRVRVGPTVFILNTFTESIGAYLANIVPMSFRTASYGDSDFVSGWTIFYWAWWISWAPFVGVFIARISRGRTIREFVLGVILAPSVVSFIWFAVLGGAAIDLQLTGTANIAEIAADNPPAALFATLQQFPLFGLMAADHDHPGRAVLRQRGRRGLGGDGHALHQGQPAPQGMDRHRVGDLHGSRRRSACWPGRSRAPWTRPPCPAVCGHRLGGAVRDHLDRPVLLHLEGLAGRGVPSDARTRGAGAGQGDVPPQRDRGPAADVGREPRRATPTLEKPGSRERSLDHIAGGWLRPSPVVVATRAREGGSMGRTRNPFRGLMDHMSEMARMREYAEGGGGAEDQRRTHATAWVPTTDISRRGRPGDPVRAGRRREERHRDLARQRRADLVRRAQGGSRKT